MSPASSARARPRIPLFPASILAALAVAACSSGSGSAGSDGAHRPSGPVTAPTPGATSSPDAPGGIACKSTAIDDPPECKLPRLDVNDAAFAPDHTTVVVSAVRDAADGAGAESDEVWDARTGRFVATLARGLEHAGGLAVVWSADAKRAAIAGVGDSKFGYGIFDTATWKPVARDTELVWSFPCALATDPTGKLVAVTTLIGEAWIDDLETGKKRGSVKTNDLRAAGHVCSSIAWGGDGELLGMEGLRVAKGLRAAPRPPGVPEENALVLPAPAGDGVAYLDTKGRLAVFAKHGKKKLQVLSVAPDLAADQGNPNGPVRSFAWSPDGAALVTWDTQGRVRVWDARTGEKRKDLRAGAKPMTDLADPDEERARLTWSPDGRSFAFDGGSGPELWSVEDGTQKLKLDGAPAPKEGGGPIGAARFSPDGALLVIGTGLWDVRTGAYVRTLPPFAAWVDGARFLLLAGVYDETTPLRLMRLSDGAILNIERLGDDEKPVLLAHTDDGVFQGPTDLAGCVGAGKSKPPAPEPRDTLLADFWSGRPVERTCPAP